MTCGVAPTWSTPTSPEEQILARCRQAEPAPDPIEEPQAEVVLQGEDLPGQCRLAHVQARRGTRHAPGLDDRDERAQVTQLHPINAPTS